VKKQKNPRRIR